jgi:hypothetical protein
MKKLFPDADLVMERFLGLPKSVIAVRFVQPQLTKDKNVQIGHLPLPIENTVR